jgi:hypothetical protein
VESGVVLVAPLRRRKGERTAKRLLIFGEFARHGSFLPSRRRWIEISAMAVRLGPDLQGRSTGCAEDLRDLTSVRHQPKAPAAWVHTSSEAGAFGWAVNEDAIL